MQDPQGWQQSVVVAIGGQIESTTALAAYLARLGPNVRVISSTMSDALPRASALAARLAGKAACVVIQNDVSPNALRAFLRPMIEYEIRVVLASGLASFLDDDAEPSRNQYIYDGGSNLLDPHFRVFIEEVQRQSMGPLQRLVVRSPAGRRVARPASTRTPFNDRQRVFPFQDPNPPHVHTQAHDAFAILDELRDHDVGRNVHITEILLTKGAERLVFHGRTAKDVFVEIELDGEMQGEGPLEIEAAMQRGSLICRWGKTHASLTRKAPLRDGPVHLEDVPERLEIAVRSALAHTRTNVDSAISLAKLHVARNRVLAAIDTYRREYADRPIELLLVHVPRYRNSYDELELPSLATARLAAFARGHGFTTRVADLQIQHAHEPLECFADDTLVRQWLDGKIIPVISVALEKLWASFGPDLLTSKESGKRILVGFSIVDYFGHFQMNIATCLARFVKERIGFPTVLGGERDQVDGDRALDTPNTFDYVVDGDGEVPLLGLLHLEAYGDRRASDIPGVWSRQDDLVHKNKLIRSHLNAMPRPDFDDVDFSRYLGKPTRELLDVLTEAGFYHGENIEPFAYLPYGFVKGCTAKCEFCSAKEWLDIQSPEKSVDELLAFKEKYRVRDFMFLNNLVNSSAKWVEKFCRGLVDAHADIQWTDSCRPTNISAELASLMRASGCLLLNYGAESGSDKILELMKKGLLSKDIVDSLRNTHRAGIINRVNFIAGYFHETEEDVDATIALVETLAEEIDIVGCFQGFYLFPGMGVEPEKAGIVLREGLDRLKTGQATLAYDEIGGLKWEEKRDRIDASRNRILARMNDLHIRTLDKINEYDLFWMSRRFDKATVTRFLLQIPRSPIGRRNQAALLPGGRRGLASVQLDGEG